MQSAAIVDPSASAVLSNITSAVHEKLKLGTPGLRAPSALWTSVVVVLSLLVLEQVVYRSKKGPLPGAKWTIPVIGKFWDSLNPTLEGYKRQWNLGELSAISVFNMSVSCCRRGCVASRVDPKRTDR